jgi:hypothetical protein
MTAAGIVGDSEPVSSMTDVLAEETPGTAGAPHMPLEHVEFPLRLLAFELKVRNALLGSVTNELVAFVSPSPSTARIRRVSAADCGAAVGGEQEKMTDGDQRSWSAPTPRLTRREPLLVTPNSALKLVVSRVERPGRCPGRARAQGPPSAGRGVAGFPEPRTPGQSVPRVAAAHRKSVKRMFAALTREWMRSTPRGIPTKVANQRDSSRQCVRSRVPR